jgi:hypothetical protein
LPKIDNSLGFAILILKVKRCESKAIKKKYHKIKQGSRDPIDCGTKAEDGPTEGKNPRKMDILVYMLDAIITPHV